MSYLKRQSSHGSTRNLIAYLHGHGGQERALEEDFAFLDYRNVKAGTEWKDFDATARRYGHDKAAAGKKAVTYIHYVISPDPKDFEGRDMKEMLAKVRQCAVGWAERCLSHQQYAIIYHGDGQNGGIHAHVVAGVTDLKTRRKCHASKKDLLREREVLNEEDRKAGLSAFSGHPKDAEDEER